MNTDARVSQQWTNRSVVTKIRFRLLDISQSAMYSCSRCSMCYSSTVSSLNRIRFSTIGLREAFNPIAL
jgi:predicted transcriptional regulator YheO